LGYVALGYAALGYVALGYVALGYVALGYVALGYVALADRISVAHSHPDQACAVSPWTCGASSARSPIIES
jgi:hypothetical protein